MSKDVSVNEEEVRMYCLHHPFHRPKINIGAVAILLIVIELGVEQLTSWVFERLWKDFSLDISYIVCYIGISLFVISLFGHWIAILFIKLYQCYAPERIRRKCICQPSCSEYAIVVFRKYGMLVGGYKTYTRLFHTCKGKYYIIDNPT